MLPAGTVFSVDLEMERRAGVGEALVGADVAVIGAGAAGLAAAWRLVTAGARVTVYEAKNAVGGRMRTTALDGGVRADTGVQLLASYYTATLRLARDAGAAGLLVRAPARDALYRGGRLHEIEYGSAGSMVVSGALPGALKVRLAARYLPFLTRHAARLDPVELAAAGELDTESIAGWGERTLGRDFVELLVHPLVAAYYGATPEETSAPFFHALARAGLSVRLLGVRGGIAELAARAASALVEAGARLDTGVEVDAVAEAPGGVTVATAEGAREHDAAVVAVPPTVVPRIVELPGDAAAWYAGVRQRPTCSLALLLDRSSGVPVFGISVPRTEPPGECISAICVQESKGMGLVPGGRGALVVFPAPLRAAALAEAEPARVVDALLPAVDAVLPGVARAVARARVARFPEGVTLFAPGYLRHLARFDPRWPSPRIALAGDYLVAPTVEGAVRSGVRAAERLLHGWPRT